MTTTDLSVLSDFAAWPSDDEVKTDLELACTRCGEVLCDIEANDTLDVLARTALEHAAEHAYPAA